MSRPVPEDFAEKFSELKTINSVRKHYRAGSDTMSRWIKESGIKIGNAGRSMRPIPDDFSEKCVSMSRNALREFYNVSATTLTKWLDAHGVKAKPKVIYKTRPPADFLEKAKTLHQKALSEHYSTSVQIVRRWIKETGAEVKAYEQKARFRVKANKSFIPPPKRDNEYDLAAEYLRRFMAVSLCDKNGKWNANGPYYRVGAGVMDKHVMLRKSKEKQSREVRRLISSTSKRGSLQA